MVKNVLIKREQSKFVCSAERKKGGMKSKDFIKHLALALIMLFAGINVSFSQTNNEVTLVASGDGSTKEEATKSALRSAIEQTYGTFVSSNTKILNDKIVKDEIVTISSGNIKSFKSISENQTNGRWYVTVQATVSIGKLIEYAKSKGSEAELAGATFAMNMKLYQLNEKNQNIALDNLEKQLLAIFPTIFDYELKVYEPKYNESNKCYTVTLSVFVKTNKNVEACYTLFNNTLSALQSFSPTEYKKLGLPYCGIYIGKGDVLTLPKSLTREYYLRGEQLNINFHLLDHEMKKNVCGFVINDGNKEFYGCYNETIQDNQFSICLKDSRGKIVDKNSQCLINPKRGSRGERYTCSYIYLKYFDYFNNSYESGSLPILATPNFAGVQIASFNIQLKYSLDELSKISNFKITPVGLITKD